MDNPKQLNEQQLNELGYTADEWERQMRKDAFFGPKDPAPEIVKVKPLEWVCTKWDAKAASIFGEYVIDFDGPVFYVRGPRCNLKTQYNFEDAKSAAQADYDGRIRSCLVLEA